MVADEKPHGRGASDSYLEASTVVCAVLGVLSRWQLVGGLLLILWIGIVGANIAMGREHEAVVGLVTIQNVRSGQPALAAAASLLGGVGATGPQSSPPFIAALATSRSVLDSVGRTPVP